MSVSQRLLLQTKLMINEPGAVKRNSSLGRKLHKLSFAVLFSLSERRYTALVAEVPAIGSIKAMAVFRGSSGE